MAQRIVLCFDGTWNTPDQDTADQIVSETNVRLFHNSVRRRGADGVAQVSHYYEGVGTRWFERFTGGGFGIGVSRTIMRGYKELSSVYEPGDQVFVLGFSRGAYTARALAGVISRCGLVTADLARAAAEPDDPNPPLNDPVLKAYQYWTMRGHDDAQRRDFTAAADAFASAYCRPATITFLGVWDTVGALGIPGNIFDRFNDGLFEFADRFLSPIVEHAYHAVALDEHRKDYAATLWDRRTNARQTIEQCWFPGDHCDVGGGHKLAAGAPRLADVPLAWMQEKAGRLGLALTAAAPDLSACDATDCHDTYFEFLHGSYRARHPRHLRPVGRTPDGGETVHPSLLARRRANPTYRPENAGLPPL